jgi:hypothetical protein
MYEKIANHIGHNIEVASYGDPILNVTVECMDCHEVIVDVDSPIITCCDHEHEPHFCTHEDEVDGVFVQCACEGI